ncbi:hypothetical protein AB0H77_25825 [Streptomyces sp. NPDC050844]|uniref:hypothetical protein n=1 Tax=Streptomyces sp. NPDC050844 TaxID=3155790 RepID=UPI0033ECBFF3
MSTDNHVYGSADNGDTWHVASDGLPTRSHPTDLRYVPGAEAGRLAGWPYLATYGRSVWQAAMGRLVER